MKNLKCQCFNTVGILEESISVPFSLNMMYIPGNVRLQRAINIQLNNSLTKPTPPP